MIDLPKEFKTVRAEEEKLQFKAPVDTKKPQLIPYQADKCNPLLSDENQKYINTKLLQHR